MGRIVVGVDGSAGSLAALRFALREARARGATVTAVHVFRLPLGEVPGPFVLELPPGPMPALAEVEEALERAAWATLDRALEEVADEVGDVQVERLVLEADPATGLLDCAADADLLVVGARGHGGFIGLLVGSVADHAIRHARCPVVVVPRDRRS